MTDRSRRDVLRAGPVLLTMGVAGCLDAARNDAAGSSTSDGLPTSGQIGLTCSVDGTEFGISPGIVHVAEGATVRWTNQTNCAQRVRAYHPENDAPRRMPEGAAPFDSGFLKGDGSAYDHAFDVEGVYDYFGLHEATGQVGTVVVGRPNPTDQPGLAPPQSNLPEAARTELRRLNERARTLLAD